MHLIVVRRDLTGYQHLHPDARPPTAAGACRLRLPAAGVYRAFADFSVGGRPHDARDRPVRRRRRSGRRPCRRPVRGRPVRRATPPSCCGAARWRRAARRAAPTPSAATGGPLDGVEPYLGADGHLVALREGDLAFLHVHPEESDDAGDDPLRAPTLPSAGRYRLFLQFKHDGRVRTVAHTVEVTPMTPRDAPRRPSASSCRSPG